MTRVQPSDGFEWTQEPWGSALRCSPLGRVAEHLFTVADIRLVDDQQEWDALAQRMGVEPDALRLIQQVHGAEVAVARAAASGRPRADIIVSDDPRVAIAVRVADCTPILMADRRRGVVAAVHAGWRGTAQGAATRAVEALAQTFGSDPGDLIAAVGPCLGPCCGEVGPDVVEEFRAMGHTEPDLARWFTRGNGPRPHLDLWTANRDQLQMAGIPAAGIHVSAICTKTNSDVFHSYRAHGNQAGRMVGIIRCPQ